MGRWNICNVLALLLLEDVLVVRGGMFDIDIYSVDVRTWWTIKPELSTQLFDFWNAANVSFDSVQVQYDVMVQYALLSK